MNKERSKKIEGFFNRNPDERKKPAKSARRMAGRGSRDFEGLDVGRRPKSSSESPIWSPKRVLEVATDPRTRSVAAISLISLVVIWILVAALSQPTATRTPVTSRQTTSTVVPMVSVPDLTGKSLTEATALVRARGLHASARLRYGSARDKDMVISQIPVAGEEVEQEGYIDIEVGGGKAPAAGADDVDGITSIRPPKGALSGGASSVTEVTTSTTSATATQQEEGEAPQSAASTSTDAQKQRATATTIAAANPAVASGPLAGRTIMIDPGHQRRGNPGLEAIGPGSSTKKAKVTSGATGVSSRIPEYQLVLTMALRIKSKLEAQGAKVMLTRHSHDINITNQERAQKGNRAGADLVIRIHADGNDDRSVVGISTLYPGVNRWTGSIRAKSFAAARHIHAAVISETDRWDRGVKPRTDLTGFNWSKVPVALLETGFLSNSAEDKLLNTDAEQERIAKGVARGTVDYFADEGR